MKRLDSCQCQMGSSGIFNSEQRICFTSSTSKCPHQWFQECQDSNLRQQATEAIYFQPLYSSQKIVLLSFVRRLKYYKNGRLKGISLKVLYHHIHFITAKLKSQITFQLKDNFVQSSLHKKKFFSSAPFCSSVLLRLKA